MNADGKMKTLLQQLLSLGHELNQLRIRRPSCFTLAAILFPERLFLGDCADKLSVRWLLRRLFLLFVYPGTMLELFHRKSSVAASCRLAAWIQKILLAMDYSMGASSTNIY